MCSPRTAHKRIKRGSKLQWYSRCIIWDVAEQLWKDCVEALNDAEFIDGLHAVHTYIRKSPALRVSWTLKRQMGVQTLDDRSDEEKTKYLGACLAYK